MMPGRRHALSPAPDEACRWWLRQALERLVRRGEELGVGLALEHVVAARVFLTHFERDYDAMNEIYRARFPADRLPARTCVGVTGLARNALVEIDFIARRPIQ